MPPCCEELLCLLSSLAALERESCQDAAKALVAINALAATAQHRRRFVVFIVMTRVCVPFVAV